ncbi:MAG: lysophospholipid acyltransferase family protein [Thermoguttaceae bacterium]
MIKELSVLMFRVRYWGLENVPAEGGVLAVANHQSHLDPPLIGSGCPRQMNYLARETLFRFTPFKQLIGSVNAIPIDRDGLGISGLKESLRRLKRGEIVLIFPEGTRTPDGQIKAFRPGFTSLAVRSRSVILPISIAGAYDCWPKNNKFPMPGEIHIGFGQPILPKDYEGMDERDLAALVEARVRQCQALLLKHPCFLS